MKNNSVEINFPCDHLYQKTPENLRPVTARRVEITINPKVPDALLPDDNDFVDNESVLAAALLIRHPLISDGSHSLTYETVDNCPQGVFTWVGEDNEDIFLVQRAAHNRDSGELVVLYSYCYGFDNYPSYGHYETRKFENNQNYQRYGDAISSDNYFKNSKSSAYENRIPLETDESVQGGDNLTGEAREFSNSHEFTELESDTPEFDTLISLTGEVPLVSNHFSTHSATDIRNRAQKVAQNWNAGSKEEFDVLSSLDKDRSITAILNAVHTMSCSELTEHDLEAHLANLEIHFTVLTSNEFQNNIREIAFDHLSQYFLGAGLDSSLQEIDQYALRALKGYLDSGKCPLWLQVDIREWFDNHELTNILINF